MRRLDLQHGFQSVSIARRLPLTVDPVSAGSACCADFTIVADLAFRRSSRMFGRRESKLQHRNRSNQSVEVTPPAAARATSKQVVFLPGGTEDPFAGAKVVEPSTRTQTVIQPRTRAIIVEKGEDIGVSVKEGFHPKIVKVCTSFSVISIVYILVSQPEMVN